MGGGGDDDDDVQINYMQDEAAVRRREGGTWLVREGDQTGRGCRGRSM